MHIIPAIDLIDGKCVRLTQGDYDRKTIYNEDPLAVAREFEAAGLKRLHVVDLDGARGGGIVNHKVLEKIAGGTSMHIDWGGGMKSDEDLRIAFESGAAQVTGGTIAVNLIASGGVADLSDLDALVKLDCFGVIVGKAIYEGRISLGELVKFQ